MSKYEVAVRYEGIDFYIVEAENAEKAEEIAVNNYNNGEEAEYTGAEYEYFTDVKALPVRRVFVFQVKERLEYLRQELRAERISYGELVELQSLVKYIDDGDVELLEAAGVKEKINHD